MNQLMNGSVVETRHTAVDTAGAISPIAALLGSSSSEQPEYAYDSEVDIVTIRRKMHAPIAETDDNLPGVAVDMDDEGQVVAVEIFDFARIAASLGFVRRD